MAEIQDLIRQNLELQQQLLQILERPTNASTPHFEKFIEGEDIEDFIDKFDVLVEIHNFTNDRKIATLVTLLPSNVFTLLKNLLHPKTFNTCTYDEIKNVLVKHMKPKPLVIPSRHTFLNRKQRENETISNYMSALRNLAIPCNYPEEQLKIMLRDVFVSGLHDKVMLDRLFEEDDSDLDKVYQIALAIEKAQNSTQEILHNKITNNVNAVKINKNGAGKKFNSDKEKSSQQQKSKIQCFRCGEFKHKAPECKKTNLYCTNCKKNGHVKKVCKAKPKMHSIKIDDTIPLNSVTHNDEPFTVPIQIDGKYVKMEVDTGSAKSVLNYSTFRSISNKKLNNTNVKFRTYDKSVLIPLGVVNVTVVHGSKEILLPLYIVDNDLSPILGREWIKSLDIKWNDIKELQIVNNVPNTKLPKILEEFKEIFTEKSGKALEFTAEITLKNNSIPVFKKFRPVPYAIQPLVEKELERLEKEGVLKKVDHADYATPIVPVRKPDGKIRICADYSQTLNPQIQVPQYPVPTIENLFSNLSKGKIFAKLDIRTAYLNIPVSESTSKLLTLNTHKGLFQPLRLMYGINAAPAIWQKYIDEILHTVVQEDNVCVFYDDILIPAENEEQLLPKLRRVFQLLQENGLHLNLAKCKFFVKEVEYLGYVVSAQGVHKSGSKVKAILDVPTPRNVKEVKSFLGMVTFYAKFFPHLASMAAPLYNLTKKSSRFKWTRECERSFIKIKKEISSDRILTHYDPEKPVILAVDAGPLGLGAVISHSFENDSERPIAFASRTLNPSEKNYSQIDKEALAIKWGIEKFHFYLIGRKFTLYTDHKPLLYIFGSKSKLPGLCATRLLHYALFLQNFQFDIRYRKSEEHGNADCLSRLPISSEELMSIDSVEAFQLDHMSNLPLTPKQIAHATANDPELKPILEKLRNGVSVGANDRNFTLQSGCILHGLRVYIPKRFREPILHELHRGHLGIVKMKGLARSYVYWPKIDEEIEKLCKNCVECTKHKGSPRKNETHYWEYPAKPWERIHMDYAIFGSRIYLIIVDSHSKWPEIFIVPNMHATTLISILDSLFARYGFPVTVVSDNQKTFDSESVQEFFKERGIRHLTSPPYYASSNGQAERHVFNLKQALRCLKIRNLSDQEALNIFLSSYRRAPHVTTGYSPAFLFLKREVRTLLNVSRPDIVSEFEDKQRKKITFFDHVYEIGQRVAVRNYSSPHKKWVFGTIVSQDGELQYTVSAQNQLWRRHSNQIRPVSQEISLDSSIIPARLPASIDRQASVETCKPTTPRASYNQSTPVIPQAETSASPSTSEKDPSATSSVVPGTPAKSNGTFPVQASPSQPLAVARPRRQIRPPKRLNL